MTSRARIASGIDQNGEPRDDIQCDVAIIGGGIAGLATALSLPTEYAITLITKSTLGESNTRYAQGGLAAAIGSDDSPSLHLADTLTAGAGLVDEEAARTLVTGAPEAVAWLIKQGAQFDRRQAPSDVAATSLADQYLLGREAAHSRWRILHAHGDATGAEIERALVEAVRRRANVRVLQNARALDVRLHAGYCEGVAIQQAGRRKAVLARYGVVLANGGAGRLWSRTSNPQGATADGLALAWRAGATLTDLEFVQFHPTVLVPPDPDAEPFLISEAVRGEGAYLRNSADERFMPRYHADAELAPRDVVARAIAGELAQGQVYLDLRHLPADAIAARFPTISAVCRHYSLDLARDLIPVAPAAHYFMGGVAVDTEGRTTVPGLFACGEVSCTGVHGANRLASNSLLEGLVFGRRIAQALTDHQNTTWPSAPRLPGFVVPAKPVLSDSVLTDSPDLKEQSAIRAIMWDYVGLQRTRAGLETARAQLEQLAARRPYDPETCSMLLAAQLIVSAALTREESRGGHWRADFQEANPALDGQHSHIMHATAKETPTGLEATHAAG